MHAITIPAIVALVASSTPAFGQIEDFVPVTDEMLLNPDPADWLMINRTFDQQRFSPLEQIDRSNVPRLALAWVRGLPGGVQESTPVVYVGVMFLIEPGAGGHQRHRDRAGTQCGLCVRIAAKMIVEP